MVYPALPQLMRTPRLTVVHWTDDPANLNGLVCLARRWSLVSACAPSSHLKHSLPIFCRNRLPALYQYETLEQIHSTACSHIPNATGWSDMNIPPPTHTHTHGSTSLDSLLGQKTSFHDKNGKVYCNTDFNTFQIIFLQLCFTFLLPMELTNIAGFHKQHKVIHYTFHVCLTYRKSTTIANNKLQTSLPINPNPPPHLRVSQIRTLPWATWEAVIGVERIPSWWLLRHVG
jgi:hypothetical protein